jgi:hypothetical protein
VMPKQSLELTHSKLQLRQNDLLKMTLSLRSLDQATGRYRGPTARHSPGDSQTAAVIRPPRQPFCEFQLLSFDFLQNLVIQWLAENTPSSRYAAVMTCKSWLDSRLCLETPCLGLPLDRAYLRATADSLFSTHSHCFAPPNHP